MKSIKSQNFKAKGKDVELEYFSLKNISSEYIAWLNDTEVLKYSNRSILKVSSSISAKTGIAFHTRIAVAEADIVHGLTMTSSPGSRPIAPRATIKPEVLEFNAIEYFVLKKLDQSSSNCLTLGPP